ncbi:MAG: hypothetical protein ACC662_08865, partial [Planctomycetota bacterium]
LAQALGAILKGGSLVARLRGGDPSSPSIASSRFMQVILFFHFILFTVATLMSVMLLTADPVTGQAPAGDGWTFFAIAVGAVTTGLVWRATRLPEKEPDGAAAGPVTEVLADLLLWVSMMIMTYFFWGLMYADIENVRGIGLSPRGVVLLVCSSLLFVVFYLPQRYLFLVEDYRSPWTWLQVWAAMLPLAFLVVVG